ncbi:MAG: hypothetical protein LBI79_06040 [Nitrososphaerota archaeon]|jgi:hypothetical protein|nr:hypothetical protein [Nitrososphaerota archaeon]
MPRTADPNCKDHLHVHARNTFEQQVIFDLKRLAVLNKVELTDLIFESIQLMFKTRNWPQNPHQNESQKTVSHLQQASACVCGRPIERLYRIWQDKQVYKCCRGCFNKIYTNKIQAYAVLENNKIKYWNQTT